MGDPYGNLRIQIDMKPKSIILRTEIYDRVLTEARFDGIDCYVKLLNHLKSISTGQNIHALLNVRN